MENISSGACGPASVTSECCCKSESPVFVSSLLSFNDKWGNFLCRVSNKFRMQYKIDAGLYAVGKPDENAPVIVTANYRLSFNSVRKVLTDKNVWILVLDTKGINVWCAAGKGTFGTGEIVRQVNSTGLKNIVNHRILILPQLGAPGVAAHEIKKQVGFNVKFGPVKVCDLPEYIDKNNNATELMREVSFPLLDRLVLIPIELIREIKTVALFLIIAGVVSGLTSEGIIFSKVWLTIHPLMLASLAALLSGAVAVPLLLPWIPGRAFTFKGTITCLLAFGTLLFTGVFKESNIFLIVFSAIGVTAYSSYLGFSFTGSTTFTSPSGVKKELKVAWPLFLASTFIGVLLFAASILRQWEVI